MVRWWVCGALAGCAAVGTGTGTGTNPGTTGTTTTNPPVGLVEVLERVQADDAQVYSCSDLLIAASSPEDEHLLVLSVRGALADQARLAGKAVTTTFTLPHEDVRLFAVWGEHLRDWFACNDVIYDDPVIDGEANAVSGTVSLTVEPSEGATEFMPYARADAELTGVTFEDEGSDDTATLSVLTWLDQFVGWLPG